MKNIFKSLLLALPLFSLVACEEEGVDYVPADPSELNGNAAYFTNLPSAYTATGETGTIKLTINRMNTSGSGMVSLETTSSDPAAASCAPTATFAAGSKTGEIEVNYTLDYGQSAKVSVKIPSSEGYAYGMTDYSFTITRPENWTDWSVFGYGVYNYAAYFSGSDSRKPLLHRQHRMTPELEQFKMEDLFYGVDLVINYNNQTGVYSVEPFYIGYDNANYGPVWQSDLPHYDEGASYDDYPVNFNPVTGVFTITMIAYVDAGYFGIEAETITLEGYKNYNVDVAYAGMFTSVDGEVSAVAEVELGPDAEYAMLAVCPLDNNSLNATVDGLASGSIEGVQVTASGEVKVPFTYNEEGKYAIVAVTFADEEPQSAGYGDFKFVPASSNQKTWTPIFYGDYEYNIFFTDEDGGPFLDEGLVLYECDQDETLYRIENWGMGVDFLFTLDSDGVVTVLEDQETGYVSSYGMVMFSELGLFAGSTDYGWSSYNRGVFTFNLIYYVEAGNFGYGPETFTLTAEADAKIAARMKAAKEASKKMTVKDITISKEKHVRMNNKLKQY